MDEEIWKPITRWESYYEVSNHGRVRSLDRVVTTSNGHIRPIKGRVLRPHGRTKALPYDIVTLTRGGRRGNPNCVVEMPYVHTLVLEHFVGPRPQGMEVCHNDGNGMNNRVDNLRWDTHHENMLDIDRHGSRQRKSRSGYTGVYEERGQFRAVFTYKGRQHYVGTFPSAKTASEARRKARAAVFN